MTFSSSNKGTNVGSKGDDDVDEDVVVIVVFSCGGNDVESGRLERGAEEDTKKGLVYWKCQSVKVSKCRNDKVTRRRATTCYHNHLVVIKMNGRRDSELREEENTYERGI